MLFQKARLGVSKFGFARRSLATSALALSLAACGGGGGGDDESTAIQAPAFATAVPSQVTMTLTADQATADALALAVDDTVDEMSALDPLSGPSSGTLSAAVDGGALQAASARSGRTQAQDVSENASDLCSGGSLWVTASDALYKRLERWNGSGQPPLQGGDRMSLAAGNCFYYAGALFPGMPAGARLDGRATITLASYSGQPFAYSGWIVYDGFTVTQGSDSYGPLTARIEIAGNASGGGLIAVDLPHARFTRPNVSLVSATDSITVHAGTVARVAVGGSGYVDLAFNEWHFGLTSRVADAGTVTVAGAGGTTATVTPIGGDDDYRVVINGATYIVDR